MMRPFEASGGPVGLRTLRKLDEVVVAFRVLVVATGRTVVRALEDHVDDLARELQLEHLNVVLCVADGSIKGILVAPCHGRCWDLFQGRRSREVRLPLRLRANGWVRVGLDGVNTLEL